MDTLRPSLPADRAVVIARNVRAIAFMCALVGIFIIPLDLLFIGIKPSYFYSSLLDVCFAVYAAWVFVQLRGAITLQTIRQFALLTVVILCEVMLVVAEMPSVVRVYSKLPLTWISLVWAGIVTVFILCFSLVYKALRLSLEPGCVMADRFVVNVGDHQNDP